MFRPQIFGRCKFVCHFSAIFSPRLHCAMNYGDNFQVLAIISSFSPFLPSISTHWLPIRQRSFPMDPFGCHMLLSSSRGVGSPLRSPMRRNSRVVSAFSWSLGSWSPCSCCEFLSRYSICHSRNLAFLASQRWERTWPSSFCLRFWQSLSFCWRSANSQPAYRSSYFPHLLLITSIQYIDSVTKAGGIFGALTAFIAYYIGLSELLSSEDMAIIRLPLGMFAKRVYSIWIWLWRPLVLTPESHHAAKQIRSSLRIQISRLAHVSVVV